MPPQLLGGCRILIVEDEYLLADDLREALLDVGADVIGPVGSVEEAMVLTRSTIPVHAAVLDINLRGEMIFPVADELLAHGVPFIFATGYDSWALPDRFDAVPRLDKPLKGDQVAALLASALAVAG